MGVRGHIAGDWLGMGGRRSTGQGSWSNRGVQAWGGIEVGEVEVSLLYVTFGSDNSDFWFILI